MSADDPRRHFVIAIYGVGNPAPGEVQNALRVTLGTVLPDGAPFEVHEFDWNTVAPQATRTTDRLWEYSQFFSASFASAAWFRSTRSTLLQRVGHGVDAIIHVSWAGLQAILAFAFIAGALLLGLGASSRWFSAFVRQLTTSGVVPAGVGWRSWWLGTRLFELALELIRWGGLAILALLVASLTLAALEAVRTCSSRPIVVTLRRHAFLVLLAPCALLSAALFRRKGGESPFAVLTSFSYWVLMALGVGSMFALSLFLGGARTAAPWILYAPAIAAAIALWILVVQFLRAELGPGWLAGAKVLLDIGLYVGIPAYRDRIQAELDRVISGIVDREGTAIWIVAHSLGSVMALDSLTHSTAWLPHDRVRLVTLGSPIRRFFFRFFPDAFFEPSIEAAARTVARRVGTFHWLNAFRRFDYIGKSLRFSRSGLDLPTKQFWPAHANYWGDVCAARTVFAGWQRSAPVDAGPAPVATAVPPMTGTVPESVSTGSRLLGIVTVAVLTITSVGGIGWLIVPGLSNMLVNPPAPIQAPVSTTARVRHDRGFNGEAARIHEFTFVFHDANGKERTLSSAVVGFFGLWSDPRFDYSALARFIREDCRPERRPRFYEFGWSVPCWRDDVPIVYALADPARFRVVGHDYRPGFFVRGVRLLFAAGVGLMSVVVPLMAIPLAGFKLWTLFVGDGGSVE